MFTNQDKWVCADGTEVPIDYILQGNVLMQRFATLYTRLYMPIHTAVYNILYLQNSDTSKGEPK